MWLSSYAPGDGAIAFNWMSDLDRNGECLSEPVTESDVSEWLRTPDNAERWRGWEILRLSGPDGRPTSFRVRLVEPAVRPFHTSKRLIFRNELYEYVWHGEDSHAETFSSGNTTFYAIDEDGSKQRLKNMNLILAMCFFLNHEHEFERDGFVTRKKKRPVAVPA
jgi:hypothetical protein